MKPDSKDVFSNAAAYESFVGRWSRFVGQQFITWIDPALGQTWLDVGAGTGILTQVILEQTAPAKIVAVDLSPALIEFARQRIHDNRVEFRVEDAVKLDFDSPQFDVAVAGLVLNFVPSAQQAAEGMMRAVKSSGIVAAYVWDYGGQMEMMRHFWDAATTVDPTAREMDSGQRFEICKPDNLRALFQTVGLDAIEVIPIDISTEFKDFDDYWQPFGAAQGSVSKYLRGLNDETRNAIREQLQKQLPTADDGRIPLVARAWAVKGRKSVSQ